ncbi:MAG: sulfate ABC transporter ATP-binding protein [Cyanobacteriota bacterium]|nr:sulfate ABC transporter ATP-binding protein [Cyanobacteriota bacterium]
MGIRITDVSKTFGSLKAIDNLSLDVETGSLVALLGPSGCGKSTLLRMIAGLESLDGGRIYINGSDATALPVQRRNVGFVFQHFALFKHRTVRDNIGFGLELRRFSRQRIRETVDELLHLVQLQGYGNRYPSQLSGGQRQRVSLARALALQPDVLLLDEPFSALDAKVRKELRVWLRNLQEQTNVTTVIVTHDQEEAMEVADKIVVINAGRIEQIGSAADIYDHPASPFVMRFVGDVNELHPSPPAEGGAPLFVRPHELELLEAPDGQSLPATVRRLTTFGRDFQVELELEDGQRILAQLNREQVRGRLERFTSGQRTNVALRGGRHF